MSEINNSNEEITLKDLYNKIKGTFSFLFSYRKKIIVFAFFTAVLGAAYAFFTKPQYEGRASFVLNEDSGGGMLGAYAGIASQFGINLGGGGGGGFFNPDNILLLLKSRKIIQKALLTKVDVNGKKELLANRYIDFNELHDEWEKKDHLKGFYFADNTTDRTKLTVIQDSVLNEFYKDITEKDFGVEKADKKAGIINVVYRSNDELFTKYFIEEVINSAIDFYVETSTKKSKAVVDMLQFKTDSVRMVLESRLVDAAQFKDENMGVVRARAQMQGLKKDKEVEMLYAIYIELVKNLEVSKTNLLQSTPIIQVIDSPILPLEKKKRSKIIYTLCGGFVGGFLMCGYLLGKRYLDEQLA